MLGIAKVLAKVQTAAAQPWKVALGEEPTGLKNLRHLCPGAQDRSIALKWRTTRPSTPQAPARFYIPLYLGC